MSNQQSNKAKFIVSILAMTSLAALAPAANAQTIKPNTATENILNRANLNTNSTQRQFTKKAPSPVLERLEKPLGTNALDKKNGTCPWNLSCLKRKPGTLKTPINGIDSTINPGVLNKPLPQIRK